MHSNEITSGRTDEIVEVWDDGDSLVAQGIQLGRCRTAG
jgi:hypothetical protein